ncbi:MAG: DUF1697 domain-containing protein [Caulobacterales bacterium]
MTVQIALLRGVNVGGRQLVAMADLRAFLAALGFGEPRSLLQSGNLVFEADGVIGAALEALLEAEAERRLGLRTDFLVRSAADWAAIIAANPFPREAQADPAHLVVMPLKGAPGAEAVMALRQATLGREVIHAHGRELYIVYPDGVGTSKLTGQVIERKLGMRGTARNWNTTLKLAALAG